MIRFICGDIKILSNIKMSQNIMTRIVYKKDLGGTFSSFSKATPTKTTRNLQIIGASDSRLRLRLTVPGVNYEKVLIF